MKFTQINSQSKNRDLIRTFGGLNNTYAIQDYEFEDMENMSMDDYPYIRTRAHRSSHSETCTNLYGHEFLVWINEDNDFLYDETSYGTVTEGIKQFTSMGAYVVIWPDKKMFNTNAAENRWESLEWSVTPASLTMGICDKNGNVSLAMQNATISDTQPSSSNGAVWIDTGTKTVKQYDSDSGEWLALDTYTQIYTKEDYTAYLEPGDLIRLSGCADINKDIINGEYTVYKTTKTKIIVSGFYPGVSVIATSVPTISRPVPDMDYICSVNNRLWGCSSAKHEIYCSKLGDPKRFYAYQGVSTDSYTATIASPGPFTGCAAYRGSVLFFKQNRIHKVTGSYPAQFQLTEINCRGVQPGSERSIALVNEVLYYKSVNDVMAYDGGMPYSVSGAINGETFKNAVSGTLHEKLYISMQDKAGDYWLYVYDTEKGLWCKEDKTQVSLFGFALGFDDLFYATADGELHSVNGCMTLNSNTDSRPGSLKEDAFPFSLVTGDLLLGNINRSYISSIKMRANIEPGTLVHVDVQYDNGKWINVANMDDFGEHVYSIPLLHRPCDHIKIKIHGKGDFTLMALSKTYAEGTDV